VPPISWQLTDLLNRVSLGVFMDEDQIKAIEERMTKRGYLDAAVMQQPSTCCVRMI